MKKIVLLALLGNLILLAGCTSKNSKSGTAAADTTATAQMVGNDRDDHDCIGSAGYLWSEVLSECVRIFERGVQLSSATDPAATQACFVLFSADSLRAEAFIPQEAMPTLLDKKGDGLWKNDEGLSLSRQGQSWQLLRAEEVIYKK